MRLRIGRLMDLDNNSLMLVSTGGYYPSHQEIMRMALEILRLRTSPVPTMFIRPENISVKIIKRS
jgi:hypothetical protein